MSILPITILHGIAMHEQHNKADWYLLILLAVIMMIGMSIGALYEKESTRLMIRDTIRDVINESCHDYGAYVTDQYSLVCQRK